MHAPRIVVCREQRDTTSQVREHRSLCLECIPSIHTSVDVARKDQSNAKDLFIRALMSETIGKDENQKRRHSASRDDGTSQPSSSCRTRASCS